MDHIAPLNMLNGGNFEERTRLATVIVWAHNSHVGNMSSTSYSSLGQTTLGKLCHKPSGANTVFLVCMTTYEGTVRAADAERGQCL